MALVVFILSLLLAVCGLGGIVASLDLLPTEMGLLYFGCGVMAVCTATLLFGIGVLVGRIDSLDRETLASVPYATPPEVESIPEASLAEETADDVRPEPMDEPTAPESSVAAMELPAEATPAKGDSAAVAEPESIEPEEAVNENRAGHFPTFQDVEAALARPEAPATIVGRYSAGGAHYRIYSDGSIEAETEDGEFKFASMGEFKTFIAARKT